MHLLFGLFLLASAAAAIAQQYSPTASGANLPDAPSYVAQQPKPIPEPIPNSQLIGAGTPPLALLSKQYLSFTSSDGGGPGSLIFVGASATADADTHQSATSTATSCGRSTPDKSSGSDWINSVLSITSHKGGRYCALGEGGFWKRGTYAMTRAFVAHRYDGSNSFNASELLGPGIASAMPGSYYAYPNYTGERLAARYASAVGRDTLKNMFSEFWPDFATHVLHRHP